MIDPIAGSILPVTVAHKSISSTQIPMRRDASAAVSVTSSIGFVVLGGAFNIVDSVGMIASRPKLKFPLPRLTYHIGPLASNRCVEAEPRTTTQSHTARQWLFPNPPLAYCACQRKRLTFPPPKLAHRIGAHPSSPGGIRARRDFDPTGLAAMKDRAFRDATSMISRSDLDRDAWRRRHRPEARWNPSREPRRRTSQCPLQSLMAARSFDGRIIGGRESAASSQCRRGSTGWL